MKYIFNVTPQKVINVLYQYLNIIALIKYFKINSHFIVFIQNNEILKNNFI